LPAVENLRLNKTDVSGVENTRHATGRNQPTGSSPSPYEGEGVRG